MKNQRNPAIDALRGVALLGIFLMNIEFFYTPIEGVGMGIVEKNYQSLSMLTHFFVHGKFWSIFSLLFGAGLFWMSRSTFRFQASRLVVLFLFGFIHCLLWPGDILTSYAIAGFLALSITRSHILWGLLSVLCLFVVSFLMGHTQLGWGVVLILLSSTLLIDVKKPKQLFFFGLFLWALNPIISLLGSKLLKSGDYTKMWSDHLSAWASHQQVLTTASFIDNLIFNFSVWQEKAFFSPMQILMVLGCMCMGFAFAQIGLFEKEKIKKLIPHLFWAVPLSAIAVLHQPILSPQTSQAFYFYNSLFELGQLGQAFGYIGVLLYVFYNVMTPSWLSSAGKNSLSVYILQSFIGVCVFQWMSIKMSYMDALLFAIIIWVILIGLYHAWVKYYSSGPMEKLWKKMTLWLSPSL